MHSLSESGEWFITDEGGGRLRSGGARKASAGDDSATDDVDSKMELLVGNVTGKTAILVDDMIDTGRTLALASKTLEAAGAKLDPGPDPVTALKAVKNPAEIAGARAAHHRDGLALCRFLAWAAREAPLGEVTEIAAVERLEAFRAETGRL